MTLNIGLLGAGRIGQVHAEAIFDNALAQLVAVADVSEVAAHNVTSRFGGESRTIDDMASAIDVDAVLICTPTNTHADLVEKFSDAGKAVFCEKPIDLNIERVQACLATVAKNGTPLMVGFNQRFDPHFRAVKETVLAGKIGAIETIRIVSRDPGPPPPDYIKISGGIFCDMTIHDFDLARFLLGEEVDAVVASASNLVDPEIGTLGDFDTANLILTTASGKQCAISNSRRVTYGYDQRIEVQGSLGMASAKNQRPIDIEVATSTGFTRPVLHDFFMTRYAAAYRAGISAFISLIGGHAVDYPCGKDGLQALAIAKAAMKSVTSGRSVRISEVM